MADVTIAPGPKGVPWFGSTLRAWKDPLDLFLESQATYGDIVRFRFGPFTYYLVNDPDVVKHVLVDNPKGYTKSRNYLGLKLVLGDGLLISEGDHWRRQRKLAQPAFHRDRLAGFARTMTECTRSTIDRWRIELSEGASETIDIHEEMMRLTFRIVGLTLLSADVDGSAKEVGKAMDVAMHFANDYAEALIRLPPSLPTPANLRFKKAMKTLDDVVFRIIAERRAMAGATKHFGDDLLGMLMEATDEGTDTGMDDKQLRDELITMVLAGHETTANLMAWTFHLLSKHPEIERRVRDEAVRVLGPDGDPKLEDVKSLEYTKRVLDEALRLYPPAWAFERQAIAADQLGPYPIEAGSIIGFSPYVLHRHPAFWENPEGFDPDRFLPERSAGRPRYAYLPFGGGPRVCVGNHFAMMEAQIILAMIVRDFRMELVSSHPVVLDPMITLRPKHGIKMRRRLPLSRLPLSPRAQASAAGPSRSQEPPSGCPARHTPTSPPA